MRVLLPTDFSKNALNAILYTLDLYAKKTCAFYFLNTYQVDSFTLDNFMMVPEPGERSFEVAKIKSEQQFKKLIAILKLQADNPKHTYHTFATYNSLLEAVKNIIKKKKIDLVAMGSRGLTNSKILTYGTNAVDIMEKVTESPVLAIPENVRFSPPKEIVFPTDYKTIYKKKELNYLLEIAKMHNSFIKALHINEEVKLSEVQKNNKQLLESILENTDHSFHNLRGIKVHTGISAFLISRKSDMVAFINKKHRFFDSMFSKPLVKELGYHSRIPVLVLNNHL